MSPFDWFKKEKPLQGLTGLWGGVGSNLLSGGASGPAGYEASGGTESTTTEANPAPIVGKVFIKFISLLVMDSLLLLQLVRNNRVLLVVNVLNVW